MFFQDRGDFGDTKIALAFTLQRESQGDEFGGGLVTWSGAVVGIDV